MPSTAVYDAIKTKLQTELGGSYPIIDWEDTDDLEQNDAPFLALEEESSSERTVSFGEPGNNRVREAGAVSVHIHTPSENGMEAARNIAETVRDALRFQQLPGGVRTMNAGPPYAALINKATWSSVVVDVDFQFDQLR